MSTDSVPQLLERVRKHPTSRACPAVHIRFNAVASGCLGRRILGESNHPPLDMGDDTHPMQDDNAGTDARIPNAFHPVLSRVSLIHRKRMPRPMYEIPPAISTTPN